MGSSVRVAISAALAVPVVIALFLIMFKLIDRDYQLDDEPARKIADIVVPDKTIDTNLKEVKPERSMTQSHLQTTFLRFRLIFSWT